MTLTSKNSSNHTGNQTNRERTYTKVGNGFHCDSCNRVLKSISGFKRHRCDTSQKLAGDEIELQGCARIDGKYRCDDCGKAFVTARNFAKHTCNPRQVLVYQKKIKEQQIEAELRESKPHQCEFCGNRFAREGTLHTHKCNTRDRVMARGSKAVRMAFQLYNRYYSTYINYNKTITREQFDLTAWYTPFVNFAQYCINVNLRNPTDFMQYMVNAGVPVHKWPTDTSYRQYIAHMLRRESPTDGLERTVRYADEWAKTHDTGQYYDVFRYSGRYRVIEAISHGHISPWVLYLSRSGKEFYAQLSENELNSVWDLINTKEWIEIFQSRPDEVELVKEILAHGDW